MVHLSQNQIDSFVGNVLPIRLLGVTEYSMEHIQWTSTDACVAITSFENEERDPFTDGVLLTLMASGTADIVAAYNGVEYTCHVSAHEIQSVPPQKNLSYFIGDFHDHTQGTHNKDQFLLRKERIPYDCLKQIKDEGVLDFCVVSDHACLLTGKEYFRGFWDAFCLGEEDLVVFPGCEAENSPIREDRYGVAHKVAGEIVTVNAVNYAYTRSWDEFYARYSTSPYAISILAHPQIAGFSVKGVWNFCLDQNQTPRLKELIKGVEMGNGTDRSCNHLHEYTFSFALDHGFRVSTTCASDWHGPFWGSTVCPGRTVIMAKEKSKEAFYDAIVNRRFYASESGNVKVYYEVNGHPAPATLPEYEEYNFHVEIGLLNERLGGMPTRLQVISDYGATLWETADIQSVMEFTLRSNTARYFYLRLSDLSGNKTWSVPVWTGRAFDRASVQPAAPIDKTGVTAIEEESGCDASAVISDDPNTVFCAKNPTCSILIDLQEAKDVAALGCYPMILDRKILKERLEIQVHGKLLGDNIEELEQRVNQFPVAYEVETGLTVEDMSLQAKGLFRVFGAEEYVALPKHKARFVRLRILSTVGKESGRPEYRECRPVLSEITLFSQQ